MKVTKDGKTRPVSTGRTIKSLLVAEAVLCLLGFAAPARSAAQANEFQTNPAAGPGTVVVHTKFGGQILGYSIDQNGTQGILSESLTLSDGNFMVATETFDQNTGLILSVVAQKNETQDDFVTMGVVSNHIGLVEFEHQFSFLHIKRSFKTVNPLSSNKFTGVWTPTLGPKQIVESVSQSQGVPNVAAYVLNNDNSFSSAVFGSNVAGNTFGPMITLTDSSFAIGTPALALDSSKNTAVLGSSNLGNPFGSPPIASVDLTKGTVSQFLGIGIGGINGIAVDTATGIACTATSIDFSVEFYQIRKQFGFLIETLPGAVNQIQSGADVEVDPVNKLFLVGQPVSSTASSGSSIQVFDERGNFVESINGLNLPFSPVTIALNPGTRTGFVLVTPDLTELQSFTY